MKNIVIKLGGSLLIDRNYRINTKKIIDFSNIIKKRTNFDTIIVICGGGLIAREYINAVRSFDKDEAYCDLIGIEISRLNSSLIIASLGNVAFPYVPDNIRDLNIATLFDKIVVMGGLQPGQSTTSVALEVAEIIDAKEVVVLTDVEGIYDKDPKKYSNAQLKEELSYNQLQDIIINQSKNKQARAGEYRIFDLVSLQILKRSRIKVYIISGKDLKQFDRFWKGNRKILGTIIKN